LEEINPALDRDVVHFSPRELMMAAM